MKVQLINSYKKLSNVTDSNGLPVVENGVAKKVLRTMFRYGVKIGFSVNSTEVDALQAMAEKFPHLAVTLSTQIAALMMSGTLMDMGQIGVNEPAEIEEL